MFGITIRVHVTLFALLVFIAFASPIAGLGWGPSLAQAVLVVGVFACILIHELAHALVARRYGCPTREILLLPIGGIAQLERMPERPAQEFLVAIVGPATNLLIAAVLGGVIALAGWPIDPEQANLVGAIVVPLFWSNVVLAAFNLLPAFPMDGGRAVRAALVHVIGRVRATRVAAGLGKILAAVFIGVGLMFGPVTLVLIGVFIWFTAAQEAAGVALGATLSRVTVADAMLRSTPVIEANSSLERAAERMLAEGHRELAVSEGGRVAGVVTMQDVAAHLAEQDARGPVRGAMRRNVPIVSPMLPLDEAIESIARDGVVLVGEPDVIIGLLTADQLAAYAALHP